MSWIRRTVWCRPRFRPAGRLMTRREGCPNPPAAPFLMGGVFSLIVLWVSFLDNGVVVGGGLSGDVFFLLVSSPLQLRDGDEHVSCADVLPLAPFLRTAC